MTKDEIIAAALKDLHKRGAELGGMSDDALAYEQHVTAELQRRLALTEPDLDIPTCANFAHLGVECCPVCHDDYPDEMALVEIEFGGRAWLCCSLDRTLNPSKHAAMEQSPEVQGLLRLFNGMSDAGD